MKKHNNYIDFAHFGLRSSVSPGRLYGHYTSRINMNVKTIILLSVLAFSVISCNEEQDISQLVQIGQTRQEIKKILGDPYEIKIIKKTGGHIWGPEEEFWDKIPNDTKLEVWRYKSDAGNLNLYFTGKNNHLDYKAFAPKGVVYESAH